MGFLWQGTSRFDPPRSCRWNRKQWVLSMPPEDAIKGVFRDVMLDDEYGVRSLRSAPETIIDVGANIGIFSLWAGANYPRALIHSYEPNPTIQHALAENARQVEAMVFAEAVGRTDGSVSLRAHQGESVAGRCAIDHAGDTPLTSLRTAISRIGGTCDLLKLDCEGAEWDILKDPGCFDGVRSVRMEYHLFDKEHSLQDLLDAFRAMGFRNVKIITDPERGLVWFDR
jgi:FkbM family methyltransferase